MQEVIYRRFRHALEEQKQIDEGTLEVCDAKFLPLPDLILLDGGKGQLSSVLEIMETIDYGDTDYRFEMEGDRKYDDDYDSASLGAMGYQSQEFNAEGELEATEDDYYADDDFDDEGMDETDEF